MKRVWLRDDSGQSLVEFAIVLPILLLILFAIFDFGKLFMTDLVLEEAARDAARYASIGASDTQIDQVIVRDCAVLQTSQLTIAINPVDTERVSGEPVTVSVSYPVTLDPPLVAFVPSPLIITAVMTMRVE